MTRASDAGPRHALDCELTPQLPDARVRAAMAAFHKTSEGDAQQQGTHTQASFGRLLDLIDAVLTSPDPHVLEIGAGASGAMRAFLSRRRDARADAMEMSPMSLRRPGSPAPDLSRADR